MKSHEIAMISQEIPVKSKKNIMFLGEAALFVG